MTGSLPSLNALRAFEAIARHLHYPSAAEELNVSPAAVKQLVGKLEDFLGARLVERSGRGLVLTNTGLAGRDDLTAAMKLMEDSVRKMRVCDTSRRLIVSVEASLATTWLVPKLVEFRSCYPQVNVLIDSSQEVVDLRHSDVDVAIRYGVKDESTLVSNRLFDDHIFPACSPSLINGSTQLKQLSDLASVPLIHWDLSKMTWVQTTDKWFSWDNWLAYVGGDSFTADNGLYFSDYGLAVQAAIAGQGVVLASWPILREVVDAGLLVRPFDEVVTTDIGYDIVTTEDARDRHEVEVFVDWVLDVAGRYN